jgi:GT2 family glycosyltransferase
MRLSVVVCTKNRPAWLKWGLATLVQQELPPDETILVDGSDPGEAALNREIVSSYETLLSNLTYLTAGPGVTIQRNAGVAASTGEIVLFVDDDAILHPAYCRVIAAEFEADPSVLGVGGLIWNEVPRSKQATIFRRLFTMTDNLRPNVTRSGDAGHLYSLKGKSEVQVLSGSNMAFRRSAFTEHGLLFDENLVGYGFGEDQLFCLQASAKGKLVQTDRALVMHGFRRTDRLTEKYARDQVTHAAYIFGRAGRSRGGTRTALLWRLLGRTIYELASGLARGRWDAARGSLHGLVHVVTNLRNIESAPHHLLPETKALDQSAVSRTPADDEIAG